jgi:CRISPR-associated endonuclease Cas1
MAADKTVRQLPHSNNSHIELLVPSHGVVTLCGYGIQVRVDRGHLFIGDGIGAERRSCRLPRVRHGLKRLVCIGSDGSVSLAALRWLADQKASFVMLERDGSVLATTGPVRPSDAKLRRTQALAHTSGAAVRIARQLITQKLVGQEQVARHKLLDTLTADSIARFGSELFSAENISSIRLIESQAARLYWSAWSTLPINFPKKDLPRIPDHWLSFGARFSSLTGSPRLATNPPNAMLNYLYSVLESEARLAAAALGLDPGLGVLHADTTARDSLACDLMEPVRPQVDAYLLDWITRDPIKPEWFFEKSDGNCRLMAPLAVQLSKTAPMWGRAVAPVAERLAQELWTSTRTRSGKNQVLPTRLTQHRRTLAQGGAVTTTPPRPPQRERICFECGQKVQLGETRCGCCRIEAATRRMADVARVGRLSAHGPQAQAKRSATQLRNAQARRAWKPSRQPAWLTEQFYSEKIQPRLAQISGTAIAGAIGVTYAYGSRIRQGKCPHPRHWLALAELAGITCCPTPEGNNTLGRADGPNSLQVTRLI